MASTEINVVLNKSNIEDVQTIFQTIADSEQKWGPMSDEEKLILIQACLEDFRIEDEGGPLIPVAPMD